MRIAKRLLGTVKTREKLIKDSLIQFQGLNCQAHSIEESAMVTIVTDALEGKGPLGPELKKAAKVLAEKFNKTNPDFQFGVVGRPVGYSPKLKAPTKPAKTDKPAKADKPAKKESKPAKAEKAKPVAGKIPKKRSKAA